MHGRRTDGEARKNVARVSRVTRNKPTVHDHKLTAAKDKENMTMTKLAQRQFLLCCILLLLSLQRVSSYPYWLKCFVDLDETEVIMNYMVHLPEDAPHLVHVEARLEDETEWKTQGLVYPADTTSTVHVRLRVPSELTKQDVQHVVETTTGGSFVKPKMCEGSRSYAESYDEEVILEVDGKQDKVEVWGGWATGHFPVYLTPRNIMRKEGSEHADEL